MVECVRMEEGGPGVYGKSGRRRRISREETFYRGIEGVWCDVRGTRRRCRRRERDVTGRRVQTGGGGGDGYGPRNLRSPRGSPENFRGAPPGPVRHVRLPLPPTIYRPDLLGSLSLSVPSTSVTQDLVRFFSVRLMRDESRRRAEPLFGRRHPSRRVDGRHYRARYPSGAKDFSGVDGDARTSHLPVRLLVVAS